MTYLQLVEGVSRGTREQEIASISRGLKALARDLSTPVLALSQLSRAVENRANKRPMLADLRESGSIENDADLVMFLYRDDYYAEKEGRESDKPNTTEIIIGKQRNGPTGTVEAHFIPTQARFGEVDNSIRARQQEEAYQTMN